MIRLRFHFVNIAVAFGAGLVTGEPNWLRGGFVGGLGPIMAVFTK
jgi:hypothetical protein